MRKCYRLPLNVSNLFGVCRCNRFQTTEGYSNLDRITGNYNNKLHSSVLKGYSAYRKTGKNKVNIFEKKCIFESKRTPKKNGARRNNIGISGFISAFKMTVSVLKVTTLVLQLCRSKNLAVHQPCTPSISLRTKVQT